MNGVVEGKMKMLTVGLRNFLTSGKQNWDTCFRAIQFSHNVTQIPSLNLSPFNILFNRHPRIVTDAQILLNTQNSNIPGFAETFLKSYTKLLLKMFLKINKTNSSIMIKSQNHIKSSLVQLCTNLLCHRAIR